MRNALITMIAGLGVVATGCSDPLPPPAEGSGTVYVGPSNAADPGYNCGYAPHTQNFGDPPPTLTTRGQTLVDGDAGSKVTCRVSGTNEFSFRGDIVIPGANVSVSGTVTLKGKGKGTVSIFDSSMHDSVSSADGACTFDVSTGDLTVANGSIWVKFNCDKVTNPSVPSIQCGASGILVFKGCDE